MYADMSNLKWLQRDSLNDLPLLTQFDVVHMKEFLGNGVQSQFHLSDGVHS